MSQLLIELHRPLLGGPGWVEGRRDTRQNARQVGGVLHCERKRRPAVPVPVADGDGRELDALDVADVDLHIDGPRPKQIHLKMCQIQCIAIYGPASTPSGRVIWSVWNSYPWWKLAWTFVLLGNKPVFWKAKSRSWAFCTFHKYKRIQRATVCIPRLACTLRNECWDKVINLNACVCEEAMT